MVESVMLKLLFDQMSEKDIVARTNMISGYCKEGRVADAKKIFDEMPCRNNGKVSEVRRIFDWMEEKDEGTMSRVGFKVNYPALISILSVSSTLACLDHGKEIYVDVMELGFNTDVFVVSALITMYIKCDNLVRAEAIFQNFASKDVVMWNSMVTGYAQHGLGDDTLRVFSEMCALGLLPDDITFVGVLSACSYTGKVKEGREFFNLMVSDYKLEPKTPHYACMVDLHGQAGHISEAMNLINNITHMNMEIAEIAAKKLMGLEPKNSGPYVLLSHIYASKRRWKDVEDLSI
ncbi:pentatricopeptide repeat-containing protein At1g09410, mitochondrial-like [Aristolochia californica]|uniref:pentatricopeptide repeat-containing protein At1g09410, mitochondrial-like n=1 Tax=Aristolochia californica TaxID=171875 RepID=UPI0035DD7AC2